jgi:hypothetical protein
MNAELGLSQYAIGRGPGKQHTISAVRQRYVECRVQRAAWHRPHVALQNREMPHCRSRPPLLCGTEHNTVAYQVV